jgi:hypothetical protein
VIATLAASTARRSEPTTIRWGTVRSGNGTGDIVMSAVAPVGAALVLAVCRASSGAEPANTNTFDVSTTGWTLRQGPIDAGTARRLYIWTARNTGSLATTVTATKTAGILDFRAMLAVVWNADYDISAAGAVATSTTPNIPTVTTTAAGDVGIGIIVAPTTVAPPANWDERAEHASAPHAWMASRAWGAAGATGTSSTTLGGSFSSVAAHVALKPA